jgi:drug/metabolite transporter (DMT)-like permease
MGASALTQLVAPGGVLRQPLVSIYLLVAGVLATALAFGVQTWAQQVIPAANIAVILTLEPVFAWLTAFLFLNEKLKLRPGMGAILVLLGIVTAEILPRWRRRNQRSQATAAT